MNFLYTLFLSCILAGCASQATLTVYSQPEGAYLTEIGSGKVFGIAPVTIPYDGKAILNYRNSNGCYLVKGFEARWVSGAVASVEPITLCGSNVGSYVITFSRAADFPGLDRDLQFALQLQSIRAQSQQAQAAKDAAAAAMYQALNPPQQKPINCMSTQLGNSVQTNCQ